MGFKICQLNYRVKRQDLSIAEMSPWQTNLGLLIAQPSVHSLLFLQKSLVECSQCSIHQYFSLGSSCLPICITKLVTLTARSCEINLFFKNNNVEFSSINYYLFFKHKMFKNYELYYYRFRTTSVMNTRVKNYASGLVWFWEIVFLRTRMSIV